MPSWHVRSRRGAGRAGRQAQRVAALGGVRGSGGGSRLRLTALGALSRTSLTRYRRRISRDSVACPGGGGAMHASKIRLAVVLGSALTALVTGILAAPGASATSHRHRNVAVERGIAPNHKLSHGTSTNWSGYAVAGGTYRTVTASWVQPSVSCSSTAYSSFWVGIDGDTSNTVEQTGTEADCNGSTPVYSAWYEMYPKFPVNFSNPVAPGDHFTATVATDGRGSFTLTLK